MHEDAVNLIKIAQNTLLFFSLSLFFYITVVISDPGVLFPTKWYTHIYITVYIWLLIRAKQWKKQWLNIFANQNTHTHKTIIWTCEVNNQHSIWQSVNKKRTFHFSLYFIIYFFSSLKTFIVDFPTDFLVCSIVMFAMLNNSIVLHS